MKLFAKVVILILTNIGMSRSVVAQAGDDTDGTGISQSEIGARLKNLYLQQDEHQIAITVGKTSGNIEIDTRNSSTSRIDASSFVNRIHYCFFIPQAKWLALGLGSSLGLEVRQDLEPELREGRSFHLPGIMIAANVRFANDWQMLLAIDQVIERWEGFEFLVRSSTQNNTQEKARVSVNLRMTDLMLSFMRRLDNSWGVQIEAHRRFGRFFRPNGAEGFAVDTILTHQDLWIGSGLTYLIH